MIIDRPRYLKQLISHKGNGLVKIITGIRRCGKSFLLNPLFKTHLLDEGTCPDHIIEIPLDDRGYRALRDPDVCYNYVRDLVQGKSDRFYVMVDEVQLMDEFVDVLNGFLHFGNVDVYATGSNSRFLSSDVITEFRGRGDELRLHPLSFSEFYSVHGDDFSKAWGEYFTYGGIPLVLGMQTPEDKGEYLKRLFHETYLRDIVERNAVRGEAELGDLVLVLASSVGSLANPKKLADTFKSVVNSKISEPTIKKFISYLEDAFVISKAQRYDIKGRKYISTPSKYYFEDVGLRNAALNFRQQEENHIMENVVYNELRIRGFSVDVGVATIYDHGAAKTTEVDFVANLGSRRYYVQVAFEMPTSEKRQTEKRSLRSIDDSFKKIIITRGDAPVSRDDHGIVTMGLQDFLLNPDSLDW